MRTDRDRKRVYYHETRDVCEGLPDLLHRFPLRALLVARPGERVVLPAGEEASELPVLNRLGFGPRPEDIVRVGAGGDIVSGDTDLEGAEVRPFSGVTALARVFAELHGARFNAPSQEICIMANSKAVFQHHCERLREERKVQIAPRGIATTRDKASEVVQAMLGSCERVIVKGAHSASGLQQVAVDRGSALADADAAALPDEVVVQEWFRHDCSPSTHCMVAPHGISRTLYSSRQLLDGRHHTGNTYTGRDAPDIPTWARKRMEDIARTISVSYAGSIMGPMMGNTRMAFGYWGPLGVDFMIDEEQRIVLAAEVNARIAAPWYAWQATRRRFGSALPFRTRSYALRKGVTIDDIASAMKGRLFTHRRMKGFVPYCFVPEHDFVYGVTYALSADDMSVLADRVDDVMAELAP